MIINPGTATSGEDFNGNGVNLHFARGESRLSTSIDIINDDKPEDAEYFNVTLTVLEGGIAGIQNEVTVTIVDDDGDKTSTGLDDRDINKENGKN